LLLIGWMGWRLMYLFELNHLLMQVVVYLRMPLFGTGFCCWKQEFVRRMELYGN
jgi:hypothetical protein